MKRRRKGFSWLWVIVVSYIILWVVILAVVIDTHPTPEERSIFPPVVEACDDPANPCTAEQLENNDNPAAYYSTLRDVMSWEELNDVGSQRFYKCIENTLGIDWGNTIPSLIEREDAGANTLFILAVNTTVSDEKARELVEAPEGFSTKNLQVVHTEQIINTRGLGPDNCERFEDDRSSVRLALGTLDSDDNLVTTKGVFTRYLSPWRMA